MKSCFADTSYFLALLIPKDINHAAASRWAAATRRPIVTSDFIVLEVANFLSASPARALFGGFYRTLENNPGTTLIRGSRDLFERASWLYVSRPDKQWSLTDCTSFEIMREHGIQDALTADRHFEQAGFNPILK